MPEESNVPERITQMEDLHRVLELDVINLKNEIERMKLMSPSPLPIETEQRIMELERISKDVDIFKQWKKMIDEVKFLRSVVMAPKPGESGSSMDVGLLKAMHDDMESMRGEIINLKVAPPLPTGKGGKVDMKAYAKGLENSKAIHQDMENLRNALMVKVAEIDKKAKADRDADMRAMSDRYVKDIDMMKNLLISGSGGKGSKSVPIPPAPPVDQKIYARLDSLEHGLQYLKEAIDKKMASVSAPKPGVPLPLGRMIEPEMISIKGKIDEILGRLQKDENYIKNIYDDVSKAGKQKSGSASSAPVPVPSATIEEVQNIKRSMMETRGQLQGVASEVSKLRGAVSEAERSAGAERNRPDMANLKERLDRIERRLSGYGSGSRPIIVE